MILSIDDLEIPKTISGNAEQFTNDYRNRTVSMRMIIKSAMAKRWRMTLNYEGRAIFPEYRKALYEKCIEMRKTPADVTFISPYDGLIYTVRMFCIQPFPPRLVHTAMPEMLSHCGAIFEEV